MMAGVHVFHDFGEAGNTIGVVGIHWKGALNSWDQMNLVMRVKEEVRLICSRSLHF